MNVTVVICLVVSSGGVKTESTPQNELYGFICGTEAERTAESIRAVGEDSLNRAI